MLIGVCMFPGSLDWRTSGLKKGLDEKADPPHFWQLLQWQTLKLKGSPVTS